MFQKLKQKKGETLVEVLVSLMIAVMCMGILTMSVTTAARVNIKTQQLDKAYSEELQTAEGHLAQITGVSSSVKMEIDVDGDGTSETKNINIILYGAGEDSSFVAYE